MSDTTHQDSFVDSHSVEKTTVDHKSVDNNAAPVPPVNGFLVFVAFGIFTSPFFNFVRCFRQTLELAQARFFDLIVMLPDMLDNPEGFESWGIPYTIGMMIRTSGLYIVMFLSVLLLIEFLKCRKSFIKWVNVTIVISLILLLLDIKPVVDYFFGDFCKEFDIYPENFLRRPKFWVSQLFNSWWYQLLKGMIIGVYINKSVQVRNRFIR